MATGNEILLEILDSDDRILMNSLSTKFEFLLKQYYFVGGMPEVVSSFIEAKSLRAFNEKYQGIKDVRYRHDTCTYLPYCNDISV